MISVCPVLFRNFCMLSVCPVLFRTFVCSRYALFRPKVVGHILCYMSYAVSIPALFHISYDVSSPVLRYKLYGASVTCFVHVLRDSIPCFVPYFYGVSTPVLCHI
jgi:hypothetical protein